MIIIGVFIPQLIGEVSDAVDEELEKMLQLFINKDRLKYFVKFLFDFCMAKEIDGPIIKPS